MPAQTLDLREMPTPQRHPTIHEAFDAREVVRAVVVLIEG
jgi:uncharacterized protein (DUF2249 family)